MQMENLLFLSILFAIILWLRHLLDTFFPYTPIIFSKTLTLIYPIFHFLLFFFIYFGEIVLHGGHPTKTELFQGYTRFLNSSDCSHRRSETYLFFVSGNWQTKHDVGQTSRGYTQSLDASFSIRFYIFNFWSVSPTGIIQKTGLDKAALHPPAVLCTFLSKFEYTVNAFWTTI